jgi:hypothetical protein
MKVDTLVYVYVYTRIYVGNCTYASICLHVTVYMHEFIACIRKELALTSPTSGGRSVGIVR